MLKKTVTYTNFDDEIVHETLYFNLSTAQLLEFGKRWGDGKVGQELADVLTTIGNSKDGAQIVALVSDILLSSYGEKSADGKRFMQSEEIQMAFKESAAFEAILFRYLMGAEDFADFVKGVMPKQIQEVQDKPKIEIGVKNSMVGEAPAYTDVPKHATLETSPQITPEEMEAVLKARMIARGTQG